MRRKYRFLLHLILILSFITISTISSLNQVAASPASLSINPSSIIDTSKVVGTTFTIKIDVGAVANLMAFEFKVGYKTAVLNATNIQLGSFFPIDSFVPKKEINDTIGYVWYGVSLRYVGGKTGSGTLAIITFKVESLGGSCIYLYDTILSNQYGNPIIIDSVSDGQFVNSLTTRDIGLTSVKVASDRVVQNQTIDVTVAARNHGYSNENSTVTAYANTTVMGTPINVTDIAPGELRTLTFTWNTTGVPLGKYFISANATAVPDEIDTADNTYNMTFDFSYHTYVPITIRVSKPPIPVFKYSPAFPHVKEAVTFNASESTPDGGVIETYRWDFGDTNTTTPSIYYKTANNTFVLPGTFNVTLTIVDSEEVSATTWQLVTVYPPDVAVISVTVSQTEVTRPNPININVTVENKGGLGTFNVTACYDGKPIGDPQAVKTLKEGNNKTLTYTWDTTYVPATTTGTNYQISANATTLLYETNTSNNVFIFGNVTIYKPSGPSAGFSYSPTRPIKNEFMTFDASLSTRDPGTNAPITSYAWDFDDGTKEIYIEGVNITQTATHRYTAAGQYAVRLNVTDSNGLWDAAEVALTVYVGRPIASFTYQPASPIIGDVLTFNAWTSNPNGGTLTSYIWNFGDNNVTTTTEYIITHNYATAGAYTVTLNVTDSEGFWNATSKQVAVSKMSSTITIAVSQATITLTKNTVITGSITPARTNINVTISERKTGTQAWTLITAVKTNQTGQYSYTWTPTIYGTFEVKSNWLGDANTLQAESETKAIVVKTPPTASFTYTPSTPLAGDTISFTSTTVDPDGTIQSLNWDFGDGGKGNGQTVTHAYATRGDYTVSLTATDNDGLTHTFTKTITITARGTTGFPWTLIAGAGAIVVIAVLVAAYYLKRKKS